MRLRRGEGPDVDVVAVALGEVARLVQRDGGLACGVLDDELGLTPGQLLALLLEVEREAVGHLLAVRRQGTGQGDQQTDLDRTTPGIDTADGDQQQDDGGERDEAITSRTSDHLGPSLSESGAGLAPHRWVDDVAGTFPREDPTSRRSIGMVARLSHFGSRRTGRRRGG